MKKFCSTVLALFICAIGISQQVHDFGFWSSVGLEKKLNKKITFDITQGLRLEENYSKLGSSLTQIGLNAKLIGKLKGSIAYRYTIRPNYGDYSIKQRFQADLSSKKKLGELTMRYRIRFQSSISNIYQENPISEFDSKLRNRLKFTLDIDKKIEPYWGVEIFSSASYLLDGFRFLAGTEFDLKKKRTMKLGYIYQKGTAEWLDWYEHNLVVSYNFYFK